MSTEVKPNCVRCAHCGPPVDDLIRCDHPMWELSDSDEVRTFVPTFAEICGDFQTANRPDRTDGANREGGAES